MENITVQELKNRLEQNKNLHVLDVREPEEYQEFNIGAVLVPLSKIRNMELDAIEDWGEDENIYVHCRSGKRSVEACLILESFGYKNAINVVDGILAWKEAFGEQKIQ